MRSAPKSLRCHIGLFGRRNVGKSSLLNALTRQEVSIVSEFAGTTTDPVEKPMELLPLGPVLFIDTAGIDDAGALGEKRVRKSKLALDRTDLGVIVSLPDQWGEFEESLIRELKTRHVPVVVVFNQVDLKPVKHEIRGILLEQDVPVVETSALIGQGIADLRQALLDAAPDDFVIERSLVGDLVSAGDLVMLVVPIDKEAPKGRLITPQVRVIRELLDLDAYCMVVKERELRAALSRVNTPPRLVVTDSQAFLKVAGDTPPDIPMTSFSILFARLQGDLSEMVAGAKSIENLTSGDKVLISEACSHHPIGEDIGRVKIPRWLTQYTGAKLHFDVVQGQDFPDNLEEYKLVIHCGACMFNRRAVLSRLIHCRKAGVPMTNYGLAIAYTLGIFERALKPFPAAEAVSGNHHSGSHSISGDHSIEIHSKYIK